nr:HNH endonuclease [Clostridia bacterium]
MEKRYLQYENGVYSTNIDITVAEWKQMLSDPSIFDESSLTMIRYWYEQLDYQATSREILLQYNIDRKSTPFNGIVIGLGKRIINYLNRFEVIGTDGNKSYFILPFEGWHEDYNPNKNFVWKLRAELVQAIEELNIFHESTDNSVDNLETLNIFESLNEGKKTVSYVTKYERSSKNRRNAIKIHGNVCEICGFDFEQTYGELGKGFIQVHHIIPLHDTNSEVKIDPEKDLICICANCHVMFHRKKDHVPTPKELKNIIKQNINRKEKTK